MTASLRKHLEWSWNYATAESFADDTLRHNAQAIASGVTAGKDVSDDDLLVDFRENRCGEYSSIDPEWLPEQPLQTELYELLAMLPPASVADAL